MLDVYTSSTATAGLIIDRHSSGTYRSELYQESDGLAIKVGDGTNAPTENMRITSSTIATAGKLTVGTGTASSSQMYVYAAGDGSTTANTDLHVSPNGQMVMYGTRPWITTTNAQGTLDKHCYIASHASGHQPAIEWVRNNGQGTNQKNWLLRQETDDTLYLWHYTGSAWSTPFVFNKDGKLGVGTASPEASLHIGPKDNNHIYLASSNNSYGWKLDTDDQSNGEVPFRIIKRTGGVDSTVLTIKNQNGNVGISNLHVRGENVYLQSALVSNCTWRIMPQTGNATKLFRIYDQDNTADRLVIDASGNVGIGVTSPTVKLDVVGGNIGLDYGRAIEVNPGSASSWTNGTTKLIETNWGTGDEVRFFTPGSQSSTQKMVINSYGNVGIGQTSPAYKLDVSGNCRFTGEVYTSSSFYSDGNRSVIRGGSPTLYFRDTDHYSAMIHNNGNLLYVLRGQNDTETWTQVNGQWPWIYNLANNDSTCGGNLYINGGNMILGGGRGIRTISGQYGTVQTTGGGVNGWSGYSIDGKYVFMSDSGNHSGIYNDIDNHWHILNYRQAWVQLMYNNQVKFQTLNTGAYVNGYLGVGTSSPSQKLQVQDGHILMTGYWQPGSYFRLMGYNTGKQVQFNYNDGTWISDNNKILFGVGGHRTQKVYTMKE